MNKFVRSLPTRSQPERVTGAASSAGGSIVRLSDPEMQPGVAALKKRLANDPAAARQWLQDLGYLTGAGKVTKRYASR